MLAERQGSQIWAAKLSDPALIDQLEAEMREMKGKFSASDVRPSLVGFDQYTSALLLLTNHVISMRMEQGNPKLKHLEGPVFPMEVVEDRIRKWAAGKRNTAIERSQAKWAKKHREVSRA